MRRTVAWAVRRPLVLAYHRIADECHSPLCVSPPVLRSQLEQLLKWGLEPSALEDRAPGRFVVTFDDGYRDGLTEAVPILQSLGVPATFFVCPDYVESPPRRGELRGDGASDWLRWADLDLLQGTGHRIGSHTMSHRELPRLSDKELEYELVESKAALEERLGTGVDDFCYPRGKHDARVRAAVARASYARAVVTPHGRVSNADPLTIERVGIYRHDSPWRFAMKVLGVWRRVRPLARGYAPVAKT